MQNLLTTATLLRHATHALKLLTKLRAQLGDDGLPSTGAGMLDLAKSAKLISDIQTVLQQVDLKGIEAIDAEMGMLEDARVGVRAEAKVRLGGVLHAYGAWVHAAIHCNMRRKCCAAAWRA